MKDLKFEQKRSMSRLEAADQLAALAAALREGGEVEMEFGLGTLSLQIPDDIRGEVEVEIGNGEVELEIEFTWPTASSARKAASQGSTETARPARRKKSAPTKPGRSGTATGKDTASDQPTRKNA
ncbi:amphi-Trp domain-containing protein [Streptomyces sp. NPDC057101]|uniref:amphi-Trp domain-containing protein n=1 Tax=Streptomyces sp. NPDC057101 TaxID=3346020 RepID=UPI0036371404